MITLTAAAGTGSALETALNDTTKFEKNFWYYGCCSLCI
jgi:hypothetical protein